MKFSEALVQVREWLEREGRVSYRALKRELALDDDFLEDLKAELIDAKRLAVDEDGKVLLWIGERINGETDKGINGNTEGEKGKWGNGEKEGTPDQWTPAHLAERIRAEQAAMEARGSDESGAPVAESRQDSRSSPDVIRGL